jgi:hypothetical protein
VGATCYEEIDFESAGSPGGLNYGWRRMEGFHAFNRDEPGLCNQPRLSPPGLTLPIAEYSHRQGTAVTGGYVYRGREHSELSGIYFYGDFTTGRIWGLQQAEPGKWARYQMLDTSHYISSFGEDENGELYVVAFGGYVYKIVR